DQGKTYTFHLRSGIHYSNGRPVRASDFRYALERGFLGGQPLTPYYEGILGGAACAEHPATCDPRRGVETDDRAGTVTFHLSAADGDFMFKLALPFADAVPRGTPPPRATSAVPATGPYEIRSYTRTDGKATGVVVLVRNTEFHEWSAAAQPDGYPDRIVWRFGVPADRVVDDVEQGRVDVSLDTPPGDRLQELTTRFPTQVRTFSGAGPAANTIGVFLNTTLPPFDDVRVRRAVNYAYDRGKPVEGQPARKTCQLIPPNFAGYQP